MRKRIFGRKLKRTTNQRKALFKSLAQALVLHGRIKTTEAKAKAIRGEVEKLITHAKNKNDLNYLKRHVHTPTAERLIEISPVFKDRNGGYTRIIKTGKRLKDNASMVILEFVERIEPVNKTLKKDKSKAAQEVKTVVKKEVKKASPKKK